MKKEMPIPGILLRQGYQTKLPLHWERSGTPEVEYLMSSTIKKPTIPPHMRSFSGRDALGYYLHDPAKLPPKTLITHSPDFVVIRDKFPKALIHLLILPRDSSKNLQHPLVALSEDPEFLFSALSEAEKIRELTGAELARLYGGRAEDWKKEVRIGVHARPSMNHLHVHVISRDFLGSGMKTGKHWMTFNTGFFVDLAEFPLSEDDERWQKGWSKPVLEGELRCWRCGRGFGRQWKKLKEHMDAEVEGWKKEAAARSTIAVGQKKSDAPAGTGRAEDDNGDETE